MLPKKGNVFPDTAITGTVGGHAPPLFTPKTEVRMSS